MTNILQVDYGDGEISSFVSNENEEGDGIVVIRDPQDRNWTVSAAGEEIGGIRCPNEDLDDAPVEIYINDYNFISKCKELPFELELTGSRMDYLYLLMTAYYGENNPDKRIRRFKEVL